MGILGIIKGSWGLGLTDLDGFPVSFSVLILVNGGFMVA